MCIRLFLDDGKDGSLEKSKNATLVVNMQEGDSPIPFQGDRSVLHLPFWFLVVNCWQSDHTILFQMPEILLFDISEPQSGDGVSTGGVYPSRIRWVIEKNLKSTPKTKTSPAISLYISSWHLFCRSPISTPFLFISRYAHAQMTSLHVFLVVNNIVLHCQEKTNV